MENSGDRNCAEVFSGDPQGSAMERGRVKHRFTSIFSFQSSIVHSQFSILHSPFSILCVLVGFLLGLPPLAHAGPPEVYRIPDLKMLQNTFADLAERVKPSVVAIRTYRHVGLPAGLSGHATAKTPSNFGSGLIVRPNGFILTNQHVLEDVDVIKVVLFNGHEYDATLVQRDIRSDLAVIRIDASPLRAVTFGDVRNVRVGYWCFAVGNPFGIAYGDGNSAVTWGNVAALGRNLTSQLDRTDTRYYGDLIETSSPINPGNSGGPLFDVDGCVIGVITAIVSASGITEGAGFAIPICKRTRRIIDTLVAGESVRYGYLGVEVANPAVFIRRHPRSAHRTKGAVILRVSEPQGPAARANLRANDIIVGFADIAIEDDDHLIRVVGMTPVGTQAKVRYLRNGTPHETVVTLAERPPPHQPFNATVGSGTTTLRWDGIGVKLAEMNSATLQLHGLNHTEAGLMVISVDRGSLAHKAGLKSRDIILKYNGTRVRNLADFAKIQAANPKHTQLDLLGGRIIRIPR
ncbi:MAG: trypsin-like peptidase domain-containing protein [Phycisphaerae bacterium]|nr:trypsin-like peptidase domain-containing protein [Phycisphaerae bacterium]